MKMYILIKESVPIGHALVAAAHASLATYLRFQDADEMRQWLSGRFYKVVCKVTDNEFEQAKLTPDHVVITESSMQGQEVAMGFRPREEWPKPFKYFRMVRE